ncbi:MAG: hydroxyacid dehydrogenase [Chloroflexi bacterium]|nr:hydroxyacid dehydrogenase [Chloroflexota bacterium]
MRIVIPDDFPPVYQGHRELERLAPYGEVALFGTRAADQVELIDRLQGAAAAINIRAYSRFDAELLAALPELRILSILGTGTDNVDLEAATQRGVVVTNTPGASTVSVAELTFALMLSAARHVATADRAVRSGQWRHLEGIELRGKTLGVVGLGAIGQEVASMARAFGMKVVAWSLTPDPERARRVGATLVGLEELFGSADVVSLHLRASSRTVGLVGARELALMKPGAILVNSARGALVDEKALAEVLASGRLGAAGLDAFVQEPLPADSPLVGLENVVLSPHTGWVTAEASERLRQMPVDNLIAFFEGRPANVVNPAALG